jgi:hypothetical protein
VGASDLQQGVVDDPFALQTSIVRGEQPGLSANIERYVKAAGVAELAAQGAPGRRDATRLPRRLRRLHALVSRARAPAAASRADTLRA